MTTSPDFVDILAEFYDVPPGSVEVAVIHLESAVERMPLVDGLKASLLNPPKLLTLVSAIDGAAFVEESSHTLNCVFEEGRKRSTGELGCLLSHIGIIKQSFDTSGIEILAVFEDDCLPMLPRAALLAELKQYLTEVKAMEERFSMEGLRRILLLGCSGTYSYMPVGQRMKTTNRFNGTHAYVLNRAGMELILKTYEFLISRDKMAPIDGLLSLILRAEKQFAPCPISDQYLFSWAKELSSSTTASTAFTASEPTNSRPNGEEEEATSSG